MHNNLNRARQLRRDQTEAEKFVWQRLRGRRFANFKFRRQLPVGEYIVDFVCLDRRTIIELDGGQYNEEGGKAYDSKRDEWLRSQQFTVLRFWNHEVFTEWEVIEEAIWRQLQIDPLTPGPSPARGEGRSRRREVAREGRNGLPSRPARDAGDRFPSPLAEERGANCPSPLAGEGLGVRGKLTENATIKEYVRGELSSNPSPPAPLPQGEREETVVTPQGERGERRNRLRVGAVNYLNTKPLVYRLDRLAPQAEVVFDLPSRLANRLAGGELDVALIPSIEFFQQPDYRIVSNACIACRGPVLSVKLFSRVPPQEISSLALDEGSRTSAALVRILLRERFGTEPRLEPLPIGDGLDSSTADAVLLIGDRAIHSPPGRFAEVWDLGDAWVNWTGLPFVFAMWTARADADLEGIETALAESRDLGVAHVSDIAAIEAAPIGLTVPQCVAYLRDNLHFYLGEQELEGLKRFYELAVKLGLSPSSRKLDRHAHVASSDERVAKRRG